MKLERDFQHDLIEKIKYRFPDCIVMKNDSNYIQGIPDLLILKDDKWAALEVKKSKSSSYRPNQEYYIEKMNSMSYANTVYPENIEEVLDELQRSFETGR